MEENEKLKRLILQREEISKQVNQIKCNLFDYIAACLYYDKSYSPLNVFKRAKSFQIPVPNALYAFLNPSYPSPLLYLAFHLQCLQNKTWEMSKYLIKSVSIRL